MPQIECVADQPGRRPIRHPQHTTQLRGCEVGDGGGAFPTEADRMLGAGQPALGDTVAGV